MDKSLKDVNTHSFDCVTDVAHFLDKFSEIEAENALDSKITAGMQAMRSNFSNEEQEYIQEMLKKHPVVMESRKATAQNNGNDSVQAQQRREMCRQARLNHKTRKTQVSYKHQFAVEKMNESIDLHNHLKDMIAEAEKQLLENGFLPEKLKEMREQFSIGFQQQQQQQQELATESPEESPSEGSAEN